MSPWAPPPQRSAGAFFPTKNPDSRIPNPDSRIPNPDSRIPIPDSRAPRGSVVFFFLQLGLGDDFLLDVPGHDVVVAQFDGVAAAAAGDA